MSDRATQARGHVKTISKPYVVSAFSLDAATAKRAVRDKVEQLLDEARYLYKACKIQTIYRETRSLLTIFPVGVEH